MTREEARQYLRRTLADAAPTWHAAEAVRVLVEDAVPSTVDRDALLKEALALLEKAEHVRMDGLPLISRCPECRSPRDLSQPHEVNCSYDAFLVSPSLAAWRRETGK
jgi:hypothetical protein